MTYQADVLALSPTVYLPLNDAAGTTAVAAAGTDATYVTGLTLGQASFMGGDTSQAVLFPGSGGGRIEFNAGLFDFAGTSAHSIVMWVKPDALDNSTDRRLFSKEYPTSGTVTDGYAVKARASKFFVDRTVAGTINSQSTGVGMEVGKPHMVAVTFDGTTAKLYLDGALLLSLPLAGSLPTTTAKLTLGSKSGGGIPYSGLMKDVAVWDGTAITSAQVNALYLSGSGGRSPVGRLLGTGKRQGFPGGRIGVNNQVLRRNTSHVCCRFVIDGATPATVNLARLLVPVNCENTSFQPATSPTRTDYGRGDGGVITVKLCPIKTDGTPNLAAAYATETFNAADRYVATQTLLGLQAQPDYGVPALNIQCMYLEMGGVAVPVDTPLGLVFGAPTTPDPLSNWISWNATTGPMSIAGPHNQVALPSKYAHGAAAALDPREALLWTIDNGTTWVAGVEVGGGNLQYEYTGWQVQRDDDRMRFPFIAYQFTGDDAARFRAEMPYQSYRKDGAYTVTYRGTPRAVDVTQVAAMGGESYEVGYVKVTNLHTGLSGTSVRRLGTRKDSCALDTTISLGVGDDYTVTNALPANTALNGGLGGRVTKHENDEPFKRALGLGATTDWPIITEGVQLDSVSADATDFGQLYALDSAGTWTHFAAQPAPDVSRSKVRHAA